MDGTDRYRRALRGFGELVRAVPADGWSRPSPCPGWTAADVVEHVAGAQVTLLGLLGEEPGPLGGRDVRERWLAAEARVLAALDAGGPGRQHDTPLGRMATADLLAVGVVEPLVHGWDLARAIGRAGELDEELAAGCLELARRHEAVLRGPGMYGPALHAPWADGSAGRALLAYLGRRP